MGDIYTPLRTFRAGCVRVSTFGAFKQIGGVGYRKLLEKGKANDC